MSAPRTIPRDELLPSMHRPRATDPRRTCRAAIHLGGIRYSCGRETSGIDADRGLGHHDGIHDAFAEHGDGGSVRW